MHGMAAEGGHPLFSLTLRVGSLDLWSDRIMHGAVSYPLAELVEVGLVLYPTGSQGAVSLGVLLRTRDGRAPLFIPEDIVEAQRFLDVISVHRPDLRVPSPPFAQPYHVGYMAQPPHPSSIPQSERVWAMLSHLSVFFIPLWFPLIVWLVTQRIMPYASRQAKQTFFFHLIVNGVMLILILPMGMLVVFRVFGSTTASSDNTSVRLFPPGFFLVFAGIWLVAMLIGIANAAFGIYGAVQGYRGKPFHYPLLGRL